MLGNTLTAPELLRNKGIRFETWSKWGKTVEMLPCTGQKQYEPNNSWLQNKQIEKGLKDRKDLLGIERVERSSQLAAAEWLPQQSRARVTKKSGQEWTNFGLEENLELYLIPEEALLLLELNCLELTWEGVALSIQQAYSILLGCDRPACSMDEYRVYSHLVRQGYRLQRFRYVDGCTSNDISMQPRPSSILRRKKQIHDPLSGFGMPRDRVQTDVDDEPINDYSIVTPQASIKKLNKCETNNQPAADTASQPKITVSGGVATDTSRNTPEETLERKNVETQSLSECEKYTSNKLNGVKKLPSELYDNGIVNLPGPSNVEAKKNTGKGSKLQIISDETLLGDFKIISKWPGKRIQRNVKWMPKRDTDGSVPAIVEKIHDDSGRIQRIVSEVKSPMDSTKSMVTQEPRSSEMDTDVQHSKGRKRPMHEVIEVSDDEIEEVPRKMSRMEMLNLFPDAISGTFVPKQISRRYLPSNVWPHNIANQSIKRQVSNERQCCMLHKNTVSYNGFTPAVDCNDIAVNSRNEISRHDSCFLERNSFASRTTYQGYRGVIERSQFLRRELFVDQNSWTNMIYYRLRQNISYFGLQSFYNRPLARNSFVDFSNMTRYSCNENCPNSRTSKGKSSFKIVPGASSWAETKAKWLDEKTITIEDEDCVNEKDSLVVQSEVEVVARSVKPLVGSQNATSLAEVYKNLQIIQHATRKNFRRPRNHKQADYYRISYNLYSTTQHFKKANPGTPTYMIVVFRSENTSVIELADILRLQKDAKETPIILACVSQTSITFAELGTVRIPDIRNISSER